MEKDTDYDPDNFPPSPDAIAKLLRVSAALLEQLIPHLKTVPDDLWPIITAAISQQKHLAQSLEDMWERLQQMGVLDGIERIVKDPKNNVH